LHTLRPLVLSHLGAWQDHRFFCAEQCDDTLTHNSGHRTPRDVHNHSMIVTLTSLPPLCVVVLSNLHFAQRASLVRESYALLLDGARKIFGSQHNLMKNSGSTGFGAMRHVENFRFNTHSDPPSFFCLCCFFSALEPDMIIAENSSIRTLTSLRADK
jgi:hypothetical protein